MDKDNITEIKTPHTPGAGVYFDSTGQSHYGMSQLEALEARNRNLVRALTQALERPCPSCGRKPGEEVE